MLRNLVKFEHVIGEKIYHFLCDNDSPIEHVKESLVQFIKMAGQVEDQIKAKMAQAEEEKKANEEVKK